MSRPTALVFGATGALGSAIARRLAASYVVHGTTRRRDAGDGLAVVDPIAEPERAAVTLAGLPELDVVVWAQGTNVNDSCDDLNLETYRSVLDGNCTFVVSTLHELVRARRIRRGARLCVVSSIWQEVARPGKLSYTVSKAALGGLVRAAAADLASRGVTVNAVLPGVVDTPMTRAMLTAEQLRAVVCATPFGRLVSVDEVVEATEWLCAPGTAVTGQSVRVDLGLAGARRV